MSKQGTVKVVLFGKETLICLLVLPVLFLGFGFAYQYLHQFLELEDKFNWTCYYLGVVPAYLCTVYTFFHWHCYYQNNLENSNERP